MAQVPSHQKSKLVTFSQVKGSSPIWSSTQTRKYTGERLSTGKQAFTATNIIISSCAPTIGMSRIPGHRLYLVSHPTKVYRLRHTPTVSVHDAHLAARPATCKVG